MSRKVITSRGNVAYIKNTLHDGTVRDSMEGYVIPYDEYHIPIVKRLFLICEQIEKNKAIREAEKLLKEQEENNQEEQKDVIL